MRRAHRAFHRLIWPVLAILVAAGFTLALLGRPPPEPAEVSTGAEAGK